MLAVYRSLLSFPDVKGKARLLGLYRRVFFPETIDRVSHGLRMDLDPVEWIQVELLQRGELETRTGELIRRVLKPGDIFVDVGAHVGFYSLLARTAVGEQGRVISIDPQPYNCHRLLRNAEINGFTNMEVHVAAVGEENRLVKLSNQRATDKARLSLCLAPVNDQPQSFVVPLRRLDTLLRGAQVAQVKLIKMDVIGFELEAVRGLGSFLRQTENVLIEILDAATTRSTALLEHLKENGFALRTVAGADWKPGQELPENNLWVVRA